MESDLNFGVRIRICMHAKSHGGVNSLININFTATLSIEQGTLNTSTTVVGLATVDLSAPTLTDNYFDCTTTQRNGASLEWSVPPGSSVTISDINNGKRVSFDAISMGDLGVYTCMDPVSGESVEITLITGMFNFKLSDKIIINTTRYSGCNCCENTSGIRLG